MPYQHCNENSKCEDIEPKKAPYRMQVALHSSEFQLHNATFPNMFLSALFAFAVKRPSDRLNHRRQALRTTLTISKGCPTSTYNERTLIQTNVEVEVPSYSEKVLYL